MMIYSTDSVINSREGPGIDTHSKMDESHRTTTKESTSRRWCVAAYPMSLFNVGARGAFLTESLIELRHYRIQAAVYY